MHRYMGSDLGTTCSACCSTTLDTYSCIGVWRRHPGNPLTVHRRVEMPPGAQHLNTGFSRRLWVQSYSVGSNAHGYAHEATRERHNPQWNDQVRNCCKSAAIYSMRMRSLAGSSERSGCKFSASSSLQSDSAGCSSGSGSRSTIDTPSRSTARTSACRNCRARPKPQGCPCGDRPHQEGH